MSILLGDVFPNVVCIIMQSFITYVQSWNLVNKQSIIIDAQCRKKALMPYGNSEGAHPCSLIWTISELRIILQYPLILAWRTCPKVSFLTLRLNLN